MKTGLTKNYRFRTIPRVGQTDAGSAGEQPARDNRPGRRNHVGVEDSSTFLKLNRFWSPLCLKKLPAEGRYYLLCVKGVCPFQAEPIHKFKKIFANLPDKIRNEDIILVIDKKPHTWNSVYLEINNKTALGDKMFKKLKEMKII